MRDITDYEILVLRHISGEEVTDLMWGAAMGEAIECLFTRGLVKRVWTADAVSYEITEKGEALLNERDGE